MPPATHAPTADQTTAKILFKNFVSTPGAAFFCLDLANFYLETLFTHTSKYEYIWIPAWAVPDDIMEEYNLGQLIKNRKILLGCEGASLWHDQFDDTIRL